MKQQIELHLGGKKRKFTFGVTFLANLLERKEFDNLADLGTKIDSNPFKYGVVAMYESLVNTCNKYNKEVDFTEQDIADWLDKHPKGAFNIIQNFALVLVGTLTNKTPIEYENENNENEAKKK